MLREMGLASGTAGDHGLETLEETLVPLPQTCHPVPIAQILNIQTLRFYTELMLNHEFWKRFFYTTVFHMSSSEEPDSMKEKKLKTF